MKKLVAPLLMLFIYSCSGPVSKTQVSKISHSVLDSLLASKQYFAARDTFSKVSNEMKDLERLNIQAELDHVFNRLVSSNRRIDSLFRYYDDELSQKREYQLLRIKQMNHAKLFEYRFAYETMQSMMTNHQQLMTQDEIKDNLNTQKIWTALVNQPAQQLTILDNTTLTIKRDKLGLQNLQLTLDTVAMDFIFDTGANFCTATESTAKMLNMSLMDSTTIDVGSITGKDVKAKIAVCPLFNLGNIIVENAVFLVFPDEALAVPQAKFQINGIIGFPVIEAMKEVQLTKNGKFIVPVKRSSYDEQNLALNFLTPVIRLDNGSYTFDSGANSTILYDHYFNKNKTRIELNYSDTSITIGGAGGSITKQGFIVSFETKINNRLIRLDSVQLFKEKLKDNNYFDGNIGQDLIGQFNRLTLNFESMFIRLD